MPNTLRKPGKLLLVMVVAALLAVQCDSDSSALREAQQQASDLAEQLSAERSRFHLESARWESQRSGSESDFTGAVLVWGGTTVGFIFLVILLARERRGRRILEHVLRRILGHLRGPPHS